MPETTTTERANERYLVFCDGAARGNPGPAGAGFVVYDEKNSIVHTAAIPLGIATNNVAEYTALLEAAKYMAKLRPDHVDFRLDSELVVKQIAGEYKVRTEHLIPLYKEVVAILSKFKHTCKHIPRAQNKVADKLSNDGADKVKI